MNRRTWWIAVAIVGIIALALAGVYLRNRYLGSGADTRSKSADQVLVQARDLIGEGRYLEASRLLDDLVKREPWNDAAWALRAEALRPRGYEDFAVVSLDRAISLNPKRADYYYERGKTAVRWGDPDLAVASLEKARELGFAGAGASSGTSATSQPVKPGHALGDLQLALAEAYLMQGIYYPEKRATALDKARQYAASARKTFTEPAVPEALDAFAVYAQGKPAESLAMLEKVLDRLDGPSKIEAYLAMVRIEVLLGRNQQAQKHIDQALDYLANADMVHYFFLNPFYETFLFYRDVHFKPPVGLAEYDARGRMFERLDQAGVFYPHLCRTIHQRTREFFLARKSDDVAGMVKALKRLQHIFNHKDSHNACSSYLLLQRPMMRMSLLVELGDLYLRQGKKDEARACYREAAREMPDEKVVGDRLHDLETMR